MAKSRYWGKNAHMNDAKRAVKKEVRRQHPATLLIPLLFLLLGLAVGYFAIGILAKPTDGLTLSGESTITVPLGTDYTYREEGYRLSCLGFDATDAVSVSTNLEKNADGSYTIDTSVPGKYYIAYTSEHPLFYNGLRRVRSFTVLGGEE